MPGCEGNAAAPPVDAQGIAESLASSGCAKIIGKIAANYEAMDEALEEAAPNVEINDVPFIITEVSTLGDSIIDWRDLDDADVAQDVTSAGSCCGLSGFVDIAPIASVLAPPVVPPDRDIETMILSQRGGSQNQR